MITAECSDAGNGDASNLRPIMLVTVRFVYCDRVARAGCRIATLIYANIFPTEKPHRLQHSTCTFVQQSLATQMRPTKQYESTEVHNPQRDCAILTLAHETHQTSTV